jgi:hypothetical protein
MKAKYLWVLISKGGRLKVECALRRAQSNRDPSALENVVDVRYIQCVAIFLVSEKERTFQKKRKFLELDFKLKSRKC